MHVHVSGRNLEIGQAFHSHVAERLAAATEKYFDRALDATVTVSKEGPMFRVECALHPAQGVNLHAHAEAPNVYGSFEQAAEKIEKQLRRFKRRITNHHDSKKSTAIL